MRISKLETVTIFDYICWINFYTITLVFALNLIVALFKNDCSLIIKVIRMEEKFFWAWFISFIIALLARMLKNNIYDD